VLLVGKREYDKHGHDVVALMEPAPGRRDRRRRLILIEQLGEFLDHGAAELLGVDDRDRATIVAGHVVADADGDQLDRRTLLDVLDDPTQVPLEVIAGIDGERGVVDPPFSRRMEPPW
jgi:hypothetical protein